MSHEGLYVVVERPGTNTTNEDLEPERGPQGERWFIQLVAVEDETTAFTSIRVGKRRARGFIFHDEERVLTAARIYTFNDLFVIEPSERPVARFGGITAGDIVRAVFIGFRKRLNEGEPVK